MGTRRRHESEDRDATLRERVRHYLRANRAAAARAVLGGVAIGATASSATALPVLPASVLDGDPFDYAPALLHLDLDGGGYDVAFYHYRRQPLLTSDPGSYSGGSGLGRYAPQAGFQPRASATVGIRLLAGAQLAVTSTSNSSSVPKRLATSSDFATAIRGASLTSQRLAWASGPPSSGGGVPSMNPGYGPFNTGLSSAGVTGWIGVWANGNPFAIKLAVSAANPWNTSLELTVLDIVAGTHAGPVAAATAVPEPHSLALLGLGAAGVSALRRRRRRRTHKS